MIDHEQRIRKLEEENRNLKRRVDKLESIINQVKIRSDITSVPLLPRIDRFWQPVVR